MVDHTGKRFGLLTVTGLHERRKIDSFWSCVCDCGNTSIVRSAHLRTGNTQSCGCYRKRVLEPEVTSTLNAEKKKRASEPSGQIRSKRMTKRTSKGNLYIRVFDEDSNTEKWKSKAVLLWESHNGPVPQGHVVIFADRDKNNFGISNLLLVNKRELFYMTRLGLICNDAEYTKTGAMMAKMIIAIAERQKNYKRKHEH